MGDVVDFPQLRTCFLCRHYALRVDGAGHCRVFDEPVESEIFSARDCPGYEPE